MVCNLKVWTYLLHLTSVNIPCNQSTAESVLISFECQFKARFSLAIQSNAVVFLFLKVSFTLIRCGHSFPIEYISVIEHL